MDITPILREDMDIDISKYDLSSLTKLQQHLLLSRLNNSNIEYFTNKDYSVDLYKNKCTMETLWNLANTLPDVDIVNDIVSKLNKRSRIIILSDFDADGLSSLVTIEKCFKLLGYENLIPLHNKRVYGTGVTSKCMETLTELSKRFNKEADLLILSDHGSSNGPEYNKIRKDLFPGLPIILTDHHEVNYNLMRVENTDLTFAFVNAHRVDTMKDYSLLQTLSGCSIAYLTMLLIAGKDKYKILEPIMYLSALSTISDVMPLDNPINRYIVKTGFKHMPFQWYKLFTKVLKTTKITCRDLSFSVIPIINTGNRANCEELAYDYLNSDIDAMSKLSGINIERKAETRKCVKVLLENTKDIEYENVVVGVLYSDFSIAGNIAGNIGDRLHKPTVIFNKSDNGVLVGSIRGIIDGIDVVKALKDIENEDDKILVRFGGHKLAAGCSIYQDRLEDFIVMFNKIIGNQLVNISTTKYLYVDAYIDSDAIDLSLFKSTEIIGPYGKNWDTPIFVSKVRLSTVISIGSVSKLLLKTKHVTLEAMYMVPKETIEHLVGETVYIFYNIEITSRIPAGSLELYVQYMSKECNLEFK